MKVNVKRFIFSLTLIILVSFISGLITGKNLAKQPTRKIKENISINTPTSDILTPKIVKTIKETEWQTFKATAYCPCEKCCGKNDGITASGIKAKEGVTIAADWTVLPMFTKVEIDGLGTRIVQDKGGAIKSNHIDIYFENHQKALEFGVQEVQLKIKE